ncbi:MAG: SAM-dependent methyltransferase [Aquincola sp.]|nr:SAM-dependent methyltransferase [Aquincola sp.]
MTGYHTHQTRIAIAGVDDLLIRSLADRQQFHDPRGHAEHLGISSAAWPLFGLAWPSGLALATLLARREVRIGERILEIGCGLALPSLVGHRRGADVTASDCHPLAAGFLRANLRLNGLAPMDYRHGQWNIPLRDRERVGPLRGDTPHGSVVRGRFDLIVGSDLLYERDASGGLVAFIARHAQPQAVVWIVDPDRGNRAGFHRRMAAEGFRCAEVRLDTAAYKGRLITCERGALS